MNKTLRPAIIAGNWKMNQTPGQATALATQLAGIQPNGCQVVVCPPFVSLAPVLAALAGTPLLVGAQNCHYKASGAFTGEVAAPMLREMGVTHVILGHSERRQYFGETDETVNLRTAAALENGLTAIVCIGETLAQRQVGQAMEWVAGQVTAALAGIAPAQLAHVVLAYEPIWAIGTGQTATDDQAQEMCAHIRGVAAGLYGAATADGLSILYGGSMNAGNAAGLLAQADIDGGLIGGASLKPADFAAIVTAAGQ